MQITDKGINAGSTGTDQWLIESLGRGAGAFIGRVSRMVKKSETPATVLASPATVNSRALSWASPTAADAGGSCRRKSLFLLSRRAV